MQNPSTSINNPYMQQQHQPRGQIHQPRPINQFVNGTPSGAPNPSYSQPGVGPSLSNSGQSLANHTFNPSISSNPLPQYGVASSQSGGLNIPLQLQQQQSGTPRPATGALISNGMPIPASVQSMAPRPMPAQGVPQQHVGQPMMQPNQQPMQQNNQRIQPAQPLMQQQSSAQQPQQPLVQPAVPNATSTTSRASRRLPPEQLAAAYGAGSIAQSPTASLTGYTQQPDSNGMMNNGSTMVGQAAATMMQQTQVYGQPYGQVQQQPISYPQSSQQPHGQPAGVLKQSSWQSNSDINAMTNNFGNMGLGGYGGYTGVPGTNRAPVGHNLLGGVPLISELLKPPPSAMISSSASVSSAPTSNCDPSYKRCTMGAVPQTLQLLNKSKMPFALIISPYRNIHPGEEPVPVINPETIVRCRRCRTYINPWIQFVDQGTKWKCNLCFLSNEVPQFFDYDMETRQSVDRLKRPELTHAVVEFVAAQEYMVRPPQPVIMLFIIDVTYAAIQSGMVATAVRAILESLDSIPNTDDRTKIGFITVDHTIHFYNLNPSLTEPQMLVISDLEDVFLPQPEDLLVNLTECRQIVEALLKRIPQMFASTQNVQSALGPALQVAYKLIHPIGGKIICLQSSLPTLHAGALKTREDVKLFGTPKESLLLQPSVPFYKTLAVDCSRAQVSIDLFLFSGNYMDIATLSGCAKYTGGSVYYYPSFNATKSEDALKFAQEFTHFLGRPIGMEAVLRVRATKGIKMTAFHGNFFLRSTDLLALPNVNPDHAYGVEMTIEETLASGICCFQTAVLHTSSNGERRIRVLTYALPVTTSLADLFSSADQYALASILSKKGVDRVLSTRLEDAREAILNKLIDIISVFKSNFTTSGQSVQLLLPENLKMLPMLTMGLIKHLGFRQATNIPSDLRYFLLCLLYTVSPDYCTIMLAPRFYSLHNMDDEAGTAGEDGKTIMPRMINLSSERLDRAGLFLLENGLEIFLWVGRAVQPDLLQLIFDRPSYDALTFGKFTLPLLQNNVSIRVINIINSIRQARLIDNTTYPSITIVKEDGSDPGLRTYFLSHLIEDRMDGHLSYPQFLTNLHEAVSKVSSA